MTEVEAGVEVLKVASTIITLFGVGGILAWCFVRFFDIVNHPK
jgi:hypothetical protein